MLDDYNGAIHKEGQIGAVTTTWGHLALRNGWKIMEVYEYNGEEDSKTAKCLSVGRSKND